MTSTAIAATAPRSPATCQPVKPHSLNAAPPVENSVAAAKTRRRNAAWLARSSSISGPWQARPPAAERDVVVYLDQSRLGRPETLRTIQVNAATAIRHYSASEAEARFGPGHLHGAIQIITAR